MTNSRSDPEPRESPADYAPGAATDGGDSAEASAAKTDTETSDTEAVYGSDPGTTTGDTTGEDPQGADDTRTR